VTATAWRSLPSPDSQVHPNAVTRLHYACTGPIFVVRVVRSKKIKKKVEIPVPSLSRPPIL
jgi:hypothetical protein